MPSTMERIELDSGRGGGVHMSGNPTAGRTVVFCHPAPGSGAFDPDPLQTAKRDIRLIAVDRPGVGVSDPVDPDEWSTVSGAASDIFEILGKVDAKSVGVAGWSAGGRVALALAARAPELVDRVVLIGTPAPDEHVPWMLDDERGAIAALRGSSPTEARSIMMDQMSQAFPGPLTSEQWLPMLAVGDADEEIVTQPGVRDRLDAMMQEAFAQGFIGMVDDILGFTLQPWGFELSDVQATVLLIYGSKDPVASSRHATWWQKNLPRARVEMTPGVGHLLVVPRWGRTLSHLAPGTT